MIDDIRVFLETTYHFVMTALIWIVEALQTVFHWFPDDWNPLLRVFVMFAVFILLVSFFQWVGREFFSAKIYMLLRRYLMQRRSPHGKARWARLSELKKAGMLKSSGLFLGQWQDKFRKADMFHHGEGHFLTIAAPGGGKSSSIIIPTLLTNKDGSFVITDPKGELCAITRRHRETLGTVVYLNPFRKDFEAETGLEYPDSGFNPFDALIDNENLRTQADNFARLLCVTDRKESGSYFNDEGAELLSLFITWMARYEPPENRNLEYLYALVRRKPQQILEYMDHVHDPLLESDADRFREMLEHSPAQWAGVVSKAQLATKRYVPTTPLAQHTSKNGFDPKLLKSTDITVYILVPSMHIVTAAPWLNLVIGMLGNAVGQIGKARPVTFLLDELPALGFLPDLRTQMRQFRGAGLRMWLFSQTKAALADPDMYGETGFKDLFGLCGTKQFFQIEEFELAKEISAMCGEATRQSSSLNVSFQNQFSAVGVPLIRAEEIYNMKKGQQIILRSHMKPIRARLVPYFTRRKWRKITDKNPYRS